MVDTKRIAQSDKISFDLSDAVPQPIVLCYINAHLARLFVKVDEEFAVPHVRQDVLLSNNKKRTKIQIKKEKTLEFSTPSRQQCSNKIKTPLV